MRKRVVLLIIASVIQILAGCAMAPPYLISDPTQQTGVPISDIVKSLRCEINTFLVQNKIRGNITGSLYDKLEQARIKAPDTFAEYVRIIRRYPSVPIDGNQFASFALDLKHVDTATLSIGYDLKTPSISNPANYNDAHIGPSISATNTAETIIPYALIQANDLGPRKSYDASAASRPPLAGKFTHAYYNQPREDADYYCYNSLSNVPSVTIEQAENDINDLSTDSERLSKYKNFTRIRIANSHLTLSSWLMQSADNLMKNNERSLLSSNEGVLLGQIYYQFSLEVKPGLDSKYTLVANLVNPFVPELSYQGDYTNSFSLYLNSVNAGDALNAKAGNTQVQKPPQPVTRILCQGVANAKLSCKASVEKTIIKHPHPV